MKQNTRQSNNDAQPSYNPTQRNFQRPDEDNSKINQVNNGEQKDTEDTDPPLTEQDMEENNLTSEEADNIQWENPKPGSPETTE